MSFVVVIVNEQKGRTRKETFMSPFSSLFDSKGVPSGKEICFPGGQREGKGWGVAFSYRPGGELVSE